MKIGILTYHDGINYGAFLQVYALQKKLEELGFENKVIDYKTWSHFYKEYKSALYSKRPKRIIKNFVKVFRFKKEQNLLSKTKFITKSDEITKEGFDIIILGSDEIWNFQNKMVGYDTAYFGVPFTAKKIFSYAASFGAISEKSVIPNEIVKGLEKLNAISVRDENTKQLISKITTKEPMTVLDPTFLYDFKNEIKDCKHKNYLLIYTIGLEENYISEIREFAKKKKMMTIGVGYYLPWCDKNIMSATPFEWLSFIKNARYIVTTMFHGTIFSIKYQKKFCTISTEYRKNKLESVLKKINLKNRLVDDPKMLERVLDDLIDYKTVLKIIDEDKTSSINYLLKNINNKRD